MRDREDESRVQILSVAAVVIGSVSAFFVQPILRFADPLSLAATGTLFSFALAVSYVAMRLGLKERWLTYHFLPALPLLAWIMIPAALEASRNDRRCVSIENHMLLFTETRESDAEMFQALGCRPQNSIKPNW